MTKEDAKKLVIEDKIDVKLKISCNDEIL